MHAFLNIIFEGFLQKWKLIRIAVKSVIYSLERYSAVLFKIVIKPGNKDTLLCAKIHGKKYERAF